MKKPISKVPYLITKPGNYYLTKDLVVPANTPAAKACGIRIDADNATIDLIGRSLTNGKAGDGVGLDTFGNHVNVRIRNDVIGAFGLGLYLAGDGPYYLEDLVIENSHDVGMWIAGDFAEVRRCTIRKTGPGNSFVQGIRIEGPGGVVEDCRLSGFSRSAANIPVTGIFLASGEIQVRRNVLESVLASAAGTTAIQTGGECLLVENVLANWALGLQLGNDVYRNNSTHGCTTKYMGGNDGGGSKWVL